MCQGSSRRDPRLVRVSKLVGVVEAPPQERAELVSKYGGAVTDIDQGTVSCLHHEFIADQVRQAVNTLQAPLERVSEAPTASVLGACHRTHTGPYHEP
jgi:hypothetical protein